MPGSRRTSSASRPPRNGPSMSVTRPLPFKPRTCTAATKPRGRLQRRYLDVLRAGALWDRLAEEDPTDEQAAQALMRAHLDAGERREAIRRFERLREALRDHLGVGPDTTTVSLYEEVLAAEGAPQPSAAERAHALLAWALVHMNR